VIFPRWLTRDGVLFGSEILSDFVVWFRGSASSPFLCGGKVIECGLKLLSDKNVIRDGGRENRG
jgi:hypothetical protein